MKYEWLEEYCLAKPGVTREWKEEWGMFRYLVGGKSFLTEGGDKEGKPIVTLRLEPMFGELMREKHACVVPGYYSNKLHYNSIYRDGDVSDEEMKGFVDESYRIIFSQLTKKLQKEILEAK